MDTAAFPVFVGEKCTAVKSEPMVIDADTHSRPTSKSLRISTAPEINKNLHLLPRQLLIDLQLLLLLHLQQSQTRLFQSPLHHPVRTSRTLAQKYPTQSLWLSLAAGTRRKSYSLLASIQVRSVISVYWPENQVYYNANVTAKNC